MKFRTRAISVGITIAVIGLAVCLLPQPVDQSRTTRDRSPVTEVAPEKKVASKATKSTGPTGNVTNDTGIRARRFELSRKVATAAAVTETGPGRQVEDWRPRNFPAGAGNSVSPQPIGLLDANLSAVGSRQASTATVVTSVQPMSTGRLRRPSGISSGTEFADNTAITIQDFGTTPFQPQINVTGMSGTVTKITVVLNNFTHPLPDDLDIYLGKDGFTVVPLMSDAGGSSGLNDVTLTIDDAAVSSFPDSGSISTGSYKPTNHDANDLLFPSGSTLATFNGMAPNGFWDLVIQDDSFNGNSGTISGGWKIIIETTTSGGGGNLNPTASLSVDSSLSAPDQSVTLTATATPASGRSIAKVEFFDGVTEIHEDTAAPYTLTTNFSVGSHNLTVTATDDQGNTGSSSIQTVEVESTSITGGTVFANSGLIFINDDSTATPYPSSISVSGLSGVISKMSVKLREFTHGFPNDVDVLLESPGGQSIVLMSDVGGFSSVTDIDLLFVDTAVSGLQFDATATSGSYWPTNLGNSDSFTSPAPSGPHGQPLSAFSGTDPNGTWKLFIVDDSTGQSGDLGGGWWLAIATSVAPTINVTADKTNVTLGEMVTFTASASDQDGSVAQVEFFNHGTNSLGTDSSAPFSLALSNLPTGTNSITGRATDNDGATADSATVIVVVGANTAPNNVVLTASPSSIKQGHTVTLSSTAEDADGTVAKVEFFDGSNLLGEDTTAPYVLNVSSFTLGTKSLKSRATDDDGATTDSAPVSFTVSAPNTAPSVSLAADQTTFKQGQTVTLTATVTDDDASVPMVEFFSGMTLLSTDTTAPFSLATNFLQGSHSITAKATDNDGVSTTSAAVTLTVNPPNIPPNATSIVVTNMVIESEDFTFTAAVNDPDGTVVSVEFLYEESGNEMSFGVDASPPFAVTTNFSSTGDRILRAKATDDDGGMTTSAPVAISVVDPPSVTANSDSLAPNTIKAGESFSLGGFAVDDGTVVLYEVVANGVKIAEGNTLPVTAGSGSLAPGLHSIQLKAIDDTGAAGFSSHLGLLVTPSNQVPTVSLAVDATNGIQGGSVLLTASPFDPDDELSVVEFFNGTNLIGTVSNDLFSLQILAGFLGLEAPEPSFRFDAPLISAGTNIFTAKVTDPDNVSAVSAGVEVVVIASNVVPGVTLAASTNVAAFDEDVILTASISSNGPVVRVEFYSGAFQIGEDTTPPFAHTLRLAPGQHTIHAEAINEFGARGISAPVTINVPSFQFANNNPIAIPADPVVGIGPASAFPSTINVSGLNGAIGRVRLTLNGLNHGGQGDLRAMLVGPNGQQVVFMDRVGGSSALNAAVFSIDPRASTVLDGPVTGSSYRMAGGTPGHLTQPAPLGPFDFSFEAFSGTDPNGEWQLYIEDVGSLGIGQLDEWGLTFDLERPNTPPLVAMSAVATNLVVQFDPLELTVVASDPDTNGSIAKVEIFRGVTKLGEDFAPPYELSISNLALGTHTVKAKVTDNRGAVTWSDNLAIQVVPFVGMEAATYLVEGPIPIAAMGPAIENQVLIYSEVMNGTVGDVSIKLNGLRHQRPADLRIQLLGPSGPDFSSTEDVMVNRGLSESRNLSMTFSATASDLPNANLLQSGIYKPEGGFLNFFGNDPDLPWSLIISDESASDVHSGVLAGGWELSFTTGLTNDWPYVTASASRSVVRLENLDDLRITAHASDGYHRIEQVDFYLNGQLVGSDRTPPYTISGDSFPQVPGDYHFVATATDSMGAVGRSDFDPLTGQQNNSFIDDVVTVVGSPDFTGPVDQEASSGSTVSFGVANHIDSGDSIQWFFNSNIISGATSRNLILTNVDMAAAGGYHIEVSDGLTTKASRQASLNVMPDSVSEAWRIQTSETNAAKDLVVDATGAFYVVCENRADTSMAGKLQKYDDGGTLSWSVDIASANQRLAIDSNGDVVVAGETGATPLIEVHKFDATGTLLWRREFQGLTRSGERLTDLKIGPQNEILLVGSSTCFGIGEDIVIVKFDTAGNLAWWRTYSGSRDGAETAVAVQLDGSGDVFLAGTSRNTNGYDEVIALRYSSAGSLIWAQHWSGPAGLHDRAVGLALASDSAYVAGTSESTPVTSQPVLLKYDLNGNLVWTRRHTEQRGLADRAVAVATTSDDSVVVLAETVTTRNDADILTLKYLPDGTRDWMNIEGRPNLTSLSFDNLQVGSLGLEDSGQVSLEVDRATDSPVALAIDTSDNIYVTASSVAIGATAVHDFVAGSNGSGYRDFLTIKYDADGGRRWRTRFNAPHELDDVPATIRVHSETNIYIAGTSFTDGTRSTKAVVKYSQPAVTGANAPSILAGPVTTTVNDLDPASFNVVASGAAPLSYEWFRNGVSLADSILASGGTTANLSYSFVRGNYSGRFHVVVSNAFGQVASTIADLNVLAGPTIDQQPQGATLSVGGELILAVEARGHLPIRYTWFKNGTSIPGATNATLSIGNVTTNDAGNYFVLVEDDVRGNASDTVPVQVGLIAGALSWQRTILDSANGARIVKMTEDSAGFAYAIANLPRLDGYSDALVVKLSPAGDLIWNRRLSLTELDGIGVDGAGNVTVGGQRIIIEQSEGFAPQISDELYVIKLDNVGDLVWEYQGQDNLETKSRAHELRIGPDGDVFVTGTVYESGTQFATMRFGAEDGRLKWRDLHPASPGDGGKALALGPGGTLVSIGTKHTAEHGAVTLMRALRSDGTLLWNRTNIFTAASEVLVSGNGTIHLGAVVDDRFTIFNHDGNGTLIGEVSSIGDARELHSMISDADDNIYLHGTAKGRIDDDAVTIKFSSGVVQQWIHRLSAPDDFPDTGAGIRVADDGAVFVSATVTYPNRGTDWAVAELTPGGLGVWTNFFDGQANGDDLGGGIALGPNGSIIAGGTFARLDAQSELTFIRLRSSDQVTTPEPEIQLVSPVAGQVFASPADVIFSAAATAGGNASIVQVDYYSGPTLIGTGTQSPYSFVWSNAPAGKHDLVAVARDSVGQAAFASPVRVQVQAPVSITRQPVIPSSLGLFNSAQLAVDATGTGLQYQWRLNGVNIPGATNRIYNIRNVQREHGGSYTVVVANEVSAVTSEPVILRSNETPFIFADNFADSVETPFISFLAHRGDNSSATLEPGEFRHVTKPNGRSMWFKWTASSSGQVAIDTRGSAFDTLLAVYSGNAVNSLTEIASDDDSGGFLTSSLVFNAQQGVTYHIAVAGLGGRHGEFVVALKELEASSDVPIFGVHPISHTLAAGANIDLVAAASATGGVTYQWFHNCAPVPGATNATLQLVNVQIADAGNYVLEARSAAGELAASRPAFLEISGNSSGRTAGKLEELIDLAAGLQVSGINVGPNLRPPTRQPNGLVAAGVVNSIYPRVNTGSAGTRHFDNHGSTTQAGEPNHCDIIGGASRWYMLTADADANLTIDTIGSEIDTVIGIYTGSDFASLTEVACDNNGAPDGIRSQVTFAAQAGTSYFIGVDAANGRQGPITLNWQMQGQIQTAPTISDLQANPTANALDDVNLTVSAAGAGQLFFQWYRNGQALLNKTNTTLALTDVTTLDAGAYLVVVTNFYGSVTSAPTHLTINLLTPTINWQAPAAITYGQPLGGLQLNANVGPPGSLSYTPADGDRLNAGQRTLTASFVPDDDTVYLSTSRSVIIDVNRANLTISAANQSRPYGQANPHLQLNYSGFVYGETPAVLNAQPIASTIAQLLSAPGDYAITVSSVTASNYNVATVPGILTVTADAPMITSQPTNLTVVAGEEANFSITVTGTEPFTHQWFLDQTNLLAFGTNATLTLTNVHATNAGDYHVIVTNIVGSVTSSVAKLTVNVPPGIIAAPQDATVVALQSIMLAGEAKGTGPLAYQWLFNGSPLSGATSSNLVFNSVGTNQAGEYRLVVTNVAGSVTSSPAILTVSRATPTLAWENPAAIIYGTALGSTQLDAESPTAGTITYSPSAGTVLGAGTHQLSATLVPNDTANYANATAMVDLTVSKKALLIRADNKSREYGQANPALTVSFIGFENGEDNSVLTAQPSLATTAVPATAPGSYPITVSGATAANYLITHSNGVLTVTATAPTIITQPSDVTVNQGAPVVLSVTAAGTGPLSYQWFKGASPIPDATGSTLTLSSALPAQAGTYHVVVSNIAGSVTSATASLIVRIPPSITSQPHDVTVSALQSTNLSAQTEGTAPLHHQWFFDGAPISGANAKTLALNSVNPDQSGTYLLVVTNVAGSVTSSPAVLMVNRLTPGISWNNPAAVVYGTVLGPGQLNASSGIGGAFTYTPAAGTRLNAGTHTLGVSFSPTDSLNFSSATGSVSITVNPAPLTVRADDKSRLFGASNPSLTVRYDGFIAGESTNALTSLAVATTTAGPTSPRGDYPINVNGAAGLNYNVTHVAGTLNIYGDELSITDEPDDVTVLVGENAQFTVVASGTPPLGYQWYFNGTNALPNETNAVLSLSGVTTGQAGGYELVITNILGSITSCVAQLSVLVPPSITQQPVDTTVTALGNASLTATTAGTQPLHHQWLFNGNPIVGANGPTLVRNNVGTNLAGVYRLVVTNVAGSVTSSPAILIVNRGTPSITWNSPAAITYGAALGPVQLNAQASEAGTFVYSPPSGTVLSAGTHTLEANFIPADQANFSTAVASVQLNVGKAPLTITANSLSRLFGEPNPSLTARYSGFVNGDTPAVLLNPPTLATTANAASQPTDYPITVSGATAANYTINHVAGVLSVFANGLAITDQPDDATVVAGAAVQLAVVVSGTAPISYQWYFNGTVAIPDATDATLNLPDIQPAQAGAYRVAITNVVGGVLSRAAQITVLVPPTIDVQPSSATVSAQQNVSLTAQVSGSAPLHHQWFHDGSPIAGANSATLTLNGVNPGQSGPYHLMVTNAAGSVTSAVAQLTVNRLVPTLDWPTPSPVIYGTPLSLAQLNAAANVGGNVAYQPPIGSVLGAGSRTLVAVFTPTDTLNYSSMTGSVSLTVDRALLTITADDKTRLFGAANPPLTARYSGFVANESTNVLLSLPVLATTATPASAPATYAISVTGGSAQNYDITNVHGTLTVTADGPAISTQPGDATLVAGANATFAVVASGTGPIGYQWYFNEATALPGKTGPILALNDVQSSDNGTYHVVVSNVTGTVESRRAQLTVHVPPSVTQQPANQTVNAKASVTFAVQVAGSGPFTYQWFRDGIALTGATASSLVLTTVTTNDTRGYHVTVNGPGGTVTSRVAQLTVNRIVPTLAWQVPAPIVYGNPLSGGQLNAVGGTQGTITYVPPIGTELAAGTHTLNAVLTPSDPVNFLSATSTVSLVVNPAPLTIRAANASRQDGDPNPTLQINFIGFVYGETNTVLTTQPAISTAAVQSSPPGSYPIIVAGGAADNYQITRVNGVLTITPQGLSIISQPADLTVQERAGGSFSVVVGGTPPFSYQWYFNSNAIAGATAATLMLTDIQTNQAGRYHVAISNVVGSANSLPATLTVQSPPRIVGQPQATAFAVRGADVTFSVSANGSGPLTGQWRHDGVLLSGRTNFTLNLPNVGRSDQGSYSIVIYGSGVSVTSSPAVLRVLVPQRLSGVQALPGGGIRLQFADEGGAAPTAGTAAHFVVEAKDGLQAGTAWVPISQNGSGLVLTNGQFRFDDPSATGRVRRFYRVLEK